MRTNHSTVISGGAATVLACIIFSPSPLAAAPSFHGLGDLPGGDVWSWATAVSADGSVVVGNSNSGSGIRAFRWTKAGGIQGLDPLGPEESTSSAYAVSGDGSVVVGFSRSPAGIAEAFRWTAGGGMQGLGHLPGGGSGSFANGVSADGSVVVGSGDVATDIQPFRWSAADGMQSLGDLLAGDNWGIASAASDDGTTIVGWSGTQDYERNQAFRWTREGSMQGLGDLPGGTFFSRAAAVSADGSVVVGISHSGSGWEAFRWTSTGGMQGLGFLSVGSEATGVSGDGAIVVGIETDGLSFVEPFIWDATHGMRNLQEVLVNDYGLHLTEWTLSRVNAISADGGAIVGVGINPQGVSEAWIAVIPEPASMALLILGGISLLPGRHRRRLL